MTPSSRLRKLVFTLLPAFHGGESYGTTLLAVLTACRVGNDPMALKARVRKAVVSPGSRTVSAHSPVEKAKGPLATCWLAPVPLPPMKFGPQIEAVGVLSTVQSQYGRETLASIS